MIQIDRPTRWPRAVFLGFSAMLAACSPTAIADAPFGTEAKIPENPVALEESCAGRTDGRENWAAAAPPARIHGDTYYVGTCGIAALLITSSEGHVLLDGGVAEAAPLVAANIGKLGFKLGDVKWIGSSHEHWDHVAALAELKRLTGAQVAALPIAAQVLSSGETHAEDPQHAIAERFAPVKVDRVLNDGDAIEVGAVRLTVHATPAHAPGSASWTWRSCAGEDCRTIAYADSATLISDDAYRFSDHPERIAQARAGLARIGALPCDILVTPHPCASNLFARLAGKAPLVDANACRTYADAAATRFAARLAKETGDTGQ